MKKKTNQDLTNTKIVSGESFKGHRIPDIKITKFHQDIGTMLRCEDGIDNAIVQDAAETAWLAIREDPTRFSDIERGRAIAGITKLALGTWEEATAFENAWRVSGLSDTLGAVVYALIATHGSEGNIFLVSEGLYRIDRDLTEVVLF